MALVTLQETKGQLRVTHDEEDEDIERKMEQATTMVLVYLEAEANIVGSPVTWDETTVPGDVKAAILATVTELWRHRGDVELPARGSGGMLSAQAEGYLRMRRSPALA